MGTDVLLRNVETLGYQLNYLLYLGLGLLEYRRSYGDLRMMRENKYELKSEVAWWKLNSAGHRMWLGWCCW